jgi:hypothetical protein
VGHMGHHSPSSGAPRLGARAAASLGSGVAASPGRRPRPGCSDVRGWPRPRRRPAPAGECGRSRLAPATATSLVRWSRVPFEGLLRGCRLILQAGRAAAGTHV